MTFFTRLTDIVTCNLTQILAESGDPHAALVQVIAEMEEGLAGARRSVQTALSSRERIRGEVERSREEADNWKNKARTFMQAGREGDARQALIRKREVEDLIGGLDQQLNASEATCNHLSTMLRALEARLADASRRLVDLQIGSPINVEHTLPSSPVRAVDTAQIDLDAELEALRREVSQ